MQRGSNPAGRELIHIQVYARAVLTHWMLLASSFVLPFSPRFLHCRWSNWRGFVRLPIGNVCQEALEYLAQVMKVFPLAAQTFSFRNFLRVSSLIFRFLSFIRRVLWACFYFTLFSLNCSNFCSSFPLWNLNFLRRCACEDCYLDDVLRADYKTDFKERGYCVQF
jgi:hypothetical protein